MTVGGGVTCVSENVTDCMSAKFEQALEILPLDRNARLKAAVDASYR